MLSTQANRSVEGSNSDEATAQSGGALQEGETMKRHCHQRGPQPSQAAAGEELARKTGLERGAWTSRAARAAGDRWAGREEAQENG
jgi:hypothetical protein